MIRQVSLLGWQGPMFTVVGVVQPGSCGVTVPGGLGQQEPCGGSVAGGARQAAGGVVPLGGSLRRLGQEQRQVQRGLRGHVACGLIGLRLVHAGFRCQPRSFGGPAVTACRASDLSPGRGPEIRRRLLWAKSERQVAQLAPKLGVTKCGNGREPHFRSLASFILRVFELGPRLPLSIELGAELLGNRPLVGSVLALGRFLRTLVFGQGVARPVGGAAGRGASLEASGRWGFEPSLENLVGKECWQHTDVRTGGRTKLFR